MLVPTGKIGKQLMRDAPNIENTFVEAFSNEFFLEQLAKKKLISKDVKIQFLNYGNMQAVYLMSLGEKKVVASINQSIKYSTR